MDLGISYISTNQLPNFYGVVNHRTRTNICCPLGGAVKSLDELPSSDVLSPRQIDAWLQTSSDPRAAGDSDMGLDETEEQQMDLQQASPAPASEPSA